MFWGLVLEPQKSYAQVVETPFHVSMAALDLKNSDNQEEASTLILSQDNTEYVLANLSKKHKIFNTVLGLDFDVGEEIQFRVQGQSQIHLTGFLAGDNDDDLDEMNEEEEEEDVSHKLKEIRKAEAAKRKLKENSAAPSKKQKIFDESFNDDTDEDDFDVDEDILGDLEDEEDSEEDDESEEEDDDDSDVPSPVKDQKRVPQSPDGKQNKMKVKQQQLLQGKQGKPGNQQLGKPGQQQPGKQGNQQQGKQGNQQQKNQVNQNKTPQKNQGQNKTPQKTPQGGKQTPQGKTPQPKTPLTANKQQNNKSPQGNGEVTKKPKTVRKALKGGIIVEDITEGTGKVAASNKQVGVYYVGRLASNMKVFDKTTSGKPFNFGLGRGEVIRGWDIGVEGMREGGKRKITIPPKLAYGGQGAPPSIPPNSVLEFEVTLVNVK